jgi:TP901 family phage tail tape measure protein
MADVNANIDINIDSSNALAQLKALQRQISQFHTSIAKSSEAAALAQKGLQKNLLNSINAISGFTAEMRTVKTSAESFTDSLEKNKFSMREYFRYAGASTKTFGRLFKSEFDTIGKVAEERVKRLQTQYIKMGRDTNGAMKAMGIMPTQLNMSDYTTKVQIAAQKQALFNQLMKQGSTNLLNFGKNTQWAGRQLMVGFTLPLMLVGSAATKTFMEMEAQALKFRKVYGDLFTPQSETQQVLDNITELGKQFTKYGVAVSATVWLAAEAAAAGFQGLDLQRQTTEATRLSILGQIDGQKALETTISLQNAFGMSSEKLADSINFLNAVENQTVVSLDDITTAIPKVAPVIQQLGGDVKDLTFFMAAMKEGGINASEGANALKSGLAALINPTGKASAMLASFGINATSIVEKNKGDLKATVVEFATALNQLDPLARARAIEQMFGKFQFARLSTLFANVAKDGNQAARVLDLANSSVEQLSALSEQELGMTADSAMNKFKKTVEDLKVALIPVGQAFLEAVTPIIDFVGNILEKFANLSSGTKRLITLLTVGIGAVGPVLLMTFGLLANGIANIIKLFLTLRGGYQRLTGQTQVLGEQTQYMTMEQLDAAAAAHSLNQTHAKLTQTFTAERTAINQLISAYNSAAGAARNFSINNPGMMMPPRGGRKLASGIVSVPGPRGAGDIVPAMLSPGESVIPAEMTKKYAPLIQGMIADNIPGFKDGRGVSSASGMVFAHGAPGGNLSPQIIQQLSFAVSQSVNRHLEQATRVKGFSNFGFLAPEKLNQGKMSGAEGGQFFGQNAELATSRIYKSIVDLLPGAISDPSVKQDVVLFGKNIGEQLTLAGSKAVSEPDFYNAVANALEKTMTQATTQAFKESLPKIQKQITTIAAFGGDINRGDRGQRISLSRASQQKGLGYEKGMVSYKGQTLTSQLKKQGFSQGQQSLTPIDRIRAQTAGTGGGTNMIAGIRAGQQAKYNKQDAAILEAMGIKSARSAITATEREAQTASPSRRTRRIGQDIARGLEVGMADRQDDVALAGSQLSQAATGGIRGGSRQVPFRAPGQPGYVASNVPKSAGVNLSDITSKARMNRDALLSGQQQKRMSEMNTRMDKLNRGFMSGTFALSALSGVASMAGGNLGKFSEILFQISGPMFAFSSILQLFTGQKIVGLIKNIGKLKFGIAAIALTGLIITTKLINDAKKKELEYIYGLSNAMKTTTQQVKVLGDFFSIVPTKLPFENRNREIVGKTTRSARDRLREDASFQKQFAPTIKTLSTATAQQAQLAFTSLALNLKAQGFASEQVQTIIDALREEAGKTDVKLDVKSLDFSAESIKGLQNQIKPLLENLGQQVISGGIKQITKQSLATGELVTYTEFTNDAKKALEELGTFISETSKSSAGMFRLGIINGDQFETTLSGVLSTMDGLDEATRRVALINIFKQLDINAAPFLKNLQSAKQEMMLIALLSSGVFSKDSKTLKNLSSTDPKARQRAINTLTSAYGDLFGAINKVNKEDAILNGGGVNGAGTLNALQEKIKAIQEQTKAYIILRNAQIDEATATELSNDSAIASLVIANSKGASLKKIIKLINEYKAALKGQTDAEYRYMEAPNLFKKQLQTYQAQANLRDKIIDTQFVSKIKAENDALTIQENKLQNLNDAIENINSSQIKPIQALIDANNFALEQISMQEDAINEKYNKQIEALDKISTINQDIANTQKQRLSIADALTRGDISAAAQLVQEARAEQAQSTVSKQKDALTTNRDSQVSALGRLSIEKQNKELQLQISAIERDKLLTLQTQKETIESSIDATNRKIKSLELEVSTLKDGAYYSGKTKQDIDDLDGLIQAATAAGIVFDDLLLSQATNAESLASALKNAAAAQQALGYSTPISGQVKNERIPIVAKNAGLIFGAGMSSMYGGMVPKYLARGGSIGSDTIPAMLTPGEFVMNRKATEQFGPILSMLNESKYPSMIGNKGIPQIPINNISTSANDNSTAVYNYNLGFSINGANSNANDIARAVMKEIKNVNSQKVRGQRQ